MELASHPCTCRLQKMRLKRLDGNICYFCKGFFFKAIACCVCARICIQINKKWRICRECKKEENIQKHGWKSQYPKIDRGQLLPYSAIRDFIILDENLTSVHIHRVEVNEVVRKLCSWRQRYVFFFTLDTDPLIPDIKKRILQYLLILPDQSYDCIYKQYWQKFFADKQIEP